MELFTKIKGVLANPSGFFTSLKKEEGVGDSFLYYVVLLLFSTAMGFILLPFTQPLMVKIMSGMFNLPPELFMPKYGLGVTLFFSILGYGLTLGFSFLSAAILYVWILIFGGKEGYAKTYQLMVYSTTPGLIFGWIPFVSFFIWIWELVLLIIGTEQVHKISRTKAILMYVIPVILFITLGILLVIFVMALIKALPSAMMPAASTLG